jgi:hypothetical protein
VGALHSHSQVLYLFKGETVLVDCNAPGLVCVGNVFKILCTHPLNVHGLTTCQLGMGERKGEKKRDQWGGGRARGEFYMGRLDWQTVLQSNCQIFSSSPLHFNIKVADEDKAGGGHWGRKEGQGAPQ